MRIITHQRHPPAQRGGPDQHRVAHRIAGPVQPGSLAVPHAQDAVVATLAEPADELAAHHRGRSEFLVEPRLVDESQAVGFGQARHAGDLRVEEGER